MKNPNRERGVANAALLVAIAVWGLGWGAGVAPSDQAPVTRPVPPRVAAEGAARLLLGEVLDLNRADADSLEALPGIGPARAEAIVVERSGRPFRSVDDLQRVRGIGPRTVDGLAGLVGVMPLSSPDALPDAG